MDFREAIKVMYQNGAKIALPEWGGYWFVKDGLISVFTNDGEYTNTPWIKTFCTRSDWEIVGFTGLEPCDEYEVTSEFGFDIAIDMLKKGLAISRKGWNNKGMFVIKTSSYSYIEFADDLQESTKRLCRENEVGTTICKNTMIIYNNGETNIWVPSSSDIFAEDWFIVDKLEKDNNEKEKTYDVGCLDYYTICDRTKELQPFEKRMVKEWLELNDKIEKLENYILNEENFKESDNDMKQLMRGQLFAMKSYADYVKKRCKLLDFIPFEADKGQEGNASYADYYHEQWKRMK